MRHGSPKFEPTRLQEPNYCRDPTHDEDCGCGATPDLEYERGLGV